VPAKPAIANIALMAEYNDAANTYQVIIFKPNRFAYTIKQQTTNGLESITYTGATRFTRDTIYLTFNESSKKPPIVNYMVIDASRTYLIQYFVGNSRRIFLRIARAQPAF